MRRLYFVNFTARNDESKSYYIISCSSILLGGCNISTIIYLERWGLIRKKIFLGKYLHIRSFFLFFNSWTFKLEKSLLLCSQWHYSFISLSNPLFIQSITTLLNKPVLKIEIKTPIYLKTLIKTILQQLSSYRYLIPRRITWNLSNRSLAPSIGLLIRCDPIALSIVIWDSVFVSKVRRDPVI